MSQEEIVVGLLHLALAAWVWTRWYRRVAWPRPLGLPRPGRVGAAWVLPALTGLLALGLMGFAATDVRGTWYLLWYVVMGLAWVGGAMTLCLPRVMIRPEVDVAERRNAASWTLTQGALLGLMLAFLGGNFGDGPGWWCVAFCGVLGIGGLLVMWCVALLLGPVGARITVDRDRAAGWRAAGLWVAGGLVLGRASAGDWVSAEATLRDFWAIGWVVLPAAVVEAAITRLTSPDHDALRAGSVTTVLTGGVPALGYVAAAAIYVVGVGWW